MTSIDLKDDAHQLGVELTDHQLDQFEQYGKILAEWSERLNLTTVPPSEYNERHFLDSLAVATNSLWKPDAKVADVGTGAGFPGIPLKIAFPNISLTLIESLQKRCNFLSAVCSELALTNVEIICERGEICAHSLQKRESFDIVTARAVADLRVLAEMLLPYATIGGSVLALKSATISDELEQARRTVQLCGGTVSEIQQITLPSSGRPLVVVALEKVAQTAARFPRSYVAMTKRGL